MEYINFPYYVSICLKEIQNNQKFKKTFANLTVDLLPRKRESVDIRWKQRRNQVIGKNAKFRIISCHVCKYFSLVFIPFLTRTPTIIWMINRPNMLLDIVDKNTDCYFFVFIFLSFFTLQRLTSSRPICSIARERMKKMKLMKHSRDFSWRDCFEFHIVRL